MALGVVMTVISIISMKLNSQVETAKAEVPTPKQELDKLAQWRDKQKEHLTHINDLVDQKVWIESQSTEPTRSLLMSSKSSDSKPTKQ
jgi:hypothetical protein